MENLERVNIKRELIGCSVSLLTVLCFTLGSVAVQALDGLIPDFELNVIRLTGPILATSVFLFWKRIPPVVPRRCYVRMTVFCVLASWLTFTMYVAVELLPIGSAGSLYHAVWMIAVSISARVVLKELITPVKLVSMTLCLGGSAFVVIGLLSTVEFQNQAGPRRNMTTIPPEVENKHHLTTTVASFILGIFICFASGIIEMSVVTFTKLMQDDIGHVFILSFWASISGLVVSVIFMLILELDKLAFPTDIMNLLYLAGHTVCTGIACVIYFVALQFGSAIVCSIALNAEIPFRVLFQYVLAKDLQPIDGTVYDIIGAIVVTLGILLAPVVNLIKLRKMSANDESKQPLIGEDAEPLFGEKEDST